MTKLTALMLGVSLAAMAGAGASAQEAAPRAAANKGIEEVVVTAMKVTTNLQKTPLAVTALSADALERDHIAAPKDLDNIVPGLVVNTTPSNPLAISIRGAGYEGTENTSAQPGVSYNQNGVYIASPISLNANFLDVDTLEVLRGPQGNGARSELRWRGDQCDHDPSGAGSVFRLHRYQLRQLRL